MDLDDLVMETSTRTFDEIILEIHYDYLPLKTFGSPKPPGSIRVRKTLTK